MSDSIDVFCRIKPTQRPSGYFRMYNTLEGSGLDFQIPKNQDAGLINNTREAFSFQFNTVFDMNAAQEDVFDRVAKKAVTSAIDGFNATVFAYGQTGSGKTFTITGGAEKYNDRGIIPRAISHIYQEVQKRSDFQYSIHISYLEIYNENGYDLLDPNHETQSLEDLPRCRLREDEDGNLFVENLRRNLANNEEEALNLLFIGDTNRMISETPMNLASSRSHCLFTISLEARQEGSDTVRRSKLNLVDLAGSERIAKTNAEGRLLMEAKHINLSLHYLEQVVVALQEKGEGKRSHIPYRNSMMTNILRDSLGGNCKTVMIATVSAEPEQIDETLSTCRFAQRVGSIKQKAVVNEDVDPDLLIRRLKRQVNELKAELAMLKGGESEREIDDDERMRIKDAVNTYVDDSSPDAVLSLGDMARIREAFLIMKGMIIEGRNRGGGAPAPAPKAKKPPLPAPPTPPPPPSDKPQVDPSALTAAAEQIKKLQLQVQQRDNEINILVGMVKKKKSGFVDAETQTAANAPAASAASHDDGPDQLYTSVVVKEGGRTTTVLRPIISAGDPSSKQPQASSSSSSSAPSPSISSPTKKAPQQQQQQPQQASSSQSSLPSVNMEALGNADLLADRNRAFEEFRKSYRKNEVMEENKLILKEKYAEAKTLGDQVNAARTKINSLKALIEQLRVERAMQGLINKTGGEAASDPEEERALRELDREKDTYKKSFEKLRTTKSEIDHLHQLLERSLEQTKKDFEKWLMSAAKQRDAYIEPDASSSGVSASFASVSSSSSASASSSFSQQQSSAPLSARGRSSSAGPVPSLRPVDPEGPSISASSSAAYGPRPSSDSGSSSSNPPLSARSQSGRSSQSSLSTPRGSTGPVLTGDKEADGDILAFYEARKNVLRKSQQ